MADVPVQYYDRNGVSQTENIDPRTYGDGPPEVDPGVGDRTPFRLRGGAAQQSAWTAWFEAGGTLATLGSARSLAKAASKVRRLPGGANSIALRPTVAVRDTSRPGRYEIDYPLDKDVYDAGPPIDDLGRAFDPTFAGKNDIVKQLTWRTYLEDPANRVPPTPARAAAQLDYVRRLAGLQALDPRDLSRAQQCLGLAKENPAVAVTGVVAVLTLLTAAVGVPVTLTAAPGQPTDVTTAVGVQPVANYTVTVTWTAPTSGFPVTGYAVQLVGAGHVPWNATVASGMTSVTFDDVPMGTYVATVVATAATANAAAVAVPVTVPTAQIIATGTPDAPTVVTVVEEVDPASARRGLTVAWVPATTGPAAATAYLVTLSAPGITLPDGELDVGLATSKRYDGPPDGTYTASVVAANRSLRSAATDSATFPYTMLPAAVPDPPTGLNREIFLSRTTGKAAVTFWWSPPAAGAEVTGYRVRRTSVPPAGQLPERVTSEVGLKQTVTIDLDDVPYDVDLLAYNDRGEGKPLSTTLKFDTLSLNAGIDWTPVFGDAAVQKWTTARQNLTQMDEKAFWAQVRDALEDTANAHGGLAGYPTQLFVARLLAVWIDAPATDPTETQVAAYARSIAATSGIPQAPGTPFAPSLAVLDAATGLTSSTGASLPVRDKLFGLVRALERYLGEHT